MPRKPKKQKLAVYLFKDACTSWASVLKPDETFDSHAISGAGEMALYTQRSTPYPPKWLKFFDGNVSGPIEGLMNSSSSAALLVKASGKIFGFTFGYGKNFFNINEIEDTFGLKVALNSIDPDKIRSVDVKNLDTVVRQSKVQTSQAGSVDNFGLNIDKDILNAVTGLANDPTFGKQISGAAAFHLCISITLAELPNLCSQLYAKFKETKYKERFPWVDHVTEVKNPSLKEQLDSLLLKAINEKDFEKTFLAVPEVIDWEKVAGFKYAQNDQEIRDDIRISDILPSDPDSTHITLDWLKGRSIYVCDENGAVVNEWNLYKCINFETDKSPDGRATPTSLLTAGKWFNIDANYSATIASEVAQIPVYNNYTFPKYTKKSEGDYNDAVYNSDKANCFLMDRKNIPYGGGRNKIEFCDLFIKKSDFVHVKRFRGSACLSHLFMQGHNAAFLLRTDPNFVKKVNERLPEDWKFDETVQVLPAKHEVVYAVISKSKKDVGGVFPFFSKVSLAQIHKQLTAYGYKVALAKIEA